MAFAAAQRFRAFGIHLLASILIVSTVVAGMYLAWYPDPLARLQGWIDLLRIVIGVDIVLGPFLTFVVYSPEKKSLRIDLTMIVLLQLVALVYGVYTSAMGRPAYMVFVKDRFEVVTVAEYPEEELQKAEGSHYTEFPWLGPGVVAAATPADAKEATRILFSDVAGAGLRVMPRYYQPYIAAAPAVADHGRTLPMIEKSSPQQAKVLLDWIRSENRKPNTVCFLPLKAKLGFGLVMLDVKTGAIIGMKAIAPSWY
jgi:hypothetical protein